MSCRVEEALLSLSQLPSFDVLPNKSDLISALNQTTRLPVCVSSFRFTFIVDTRGNFVYKDYSDLNYWFCSDPKIIACVVFYQRDPYLSR